MKYSRLAPYGALSLAVLFWGLSFVATKIALRSFEPFVLVFVRFSVAACILLCVMWYRGFPSLTLREHGAILRAALLQPGLYFLFETTGLQYTSASKASLIVAIIPIAVLGLAVLFLKERFSLWMVLGMALSLLGVVFLVVGDPQVRWALDGPVLGDLCILGAVVAMALYTVSTKKITQAHSALTITGFQICYGALIFAPAFFWRSTSIQLAAVSSSAWLALLCLTLFATIGAFFFYNYALAKLSASRTAVFLNCVPVVTTIGAGVILGERLSVLQVIGGLCVLIAVYLGNVPSDSTPVAGLKRESVL
jgi:drug/metabolite transporter (DMT)-like permease